MNFSLPDRVEPETLLWLAVINQAFMDFFGPRIGYMSGPDIAGVEGFLFDTDGPWAEQRDLVCELAGISPQSVHEAAWRRLDKMTSA